MAIILAYKIEPESSQTPKPPSPSSPRNYTNINTNTNIHRHTAAAPHAPPKPAGVVTPPTSEPTIETKEPVVIPQPPGRKIVTPQPDPEDAIDAMTIWNTQFNSRRAAPRPHNTTPTSTASSIRSTVSTSWSQKLQARRKKRVSFAKQLVAVIPPSSTDLILYGTHRNLPASRRSYWARYWRSKAGRFAQGGLWITGFIVVELILLAFMSRGQKRNGVGGAAEWGHDDNI